MPSRFLVTGEALVTGLANRADAVRGATPLDPPQPAVVQTVVPATRPGLRPGTRWAG